MKQRRKRGGLWSVATLALLAGALLPEAAESSVAKAGGIRYVSKEVTLKPGKPRTLKAPCPRNTNVLGGGHYNSGGFGDVVGIHSYPYDGSDRNRKPDDGWAAQLRGFTTNHPAVVYATCAKVV